MSSKFHRYRFEPVKRNEFPAPLPFIVNEEHLPSNQKIVVFLPHSDDGRYFGVSLYLLNKNNDVKIVIVSPGHHGVDDNISKSKKIEKRQEETLCWAEMLGYKKDQITYFRADKTYENQKIHADDLQKLYWMMNFEKPTMIFIPHISDTAQAINYHTRKMVMDSVIGWITNDHISNKKKNSIFLVEYPTNHIPFLPPSDKNFTVEFSNSSLADIKHEANKSHESQATSRFDLTEKMIEAVEVITDADTIHQMGKKRKYMRYISGVSIDANSARGEHFGITKLKILGNSHFSILEERIKFPLNQKDKKKWFKS